MRASRERIENILSDNFGSARLFYFYKITLCAFIEEKKYKENRLDVHDNFHFFFDKSLRRFF